MLSSLDHDISYNTTKIKNKCLTIFLFETLCDIATNIMAINSNELLYLGDKTNGSIMRGVFIFEPLFRFGKWCCRLVYRDIIQRSL